MAIVCRVCGENLPEGMFFPSSLKKGDYICKDCTKKKFYKYKEEHPDRVRATAAKTREKHRDEIRKRNRDFYEKTKNDPNHIAARKASYEKNKNKMHENARNKRIAFNEKYKTPCKKCGESRLYLIQFHHIDPSTKAFCIGASATAKTEDVLAEEIKKCICLCSNCHDEFHYFYGANPKNPVNDLKEYLKTGDGYE